MSQNASPLRVVVMAGGTGGHVFPALAVAENLISRGIDVEWIGGARGLETEVVPAAGIKLHSLGTEGVRGKGVFSLLKAPFLISKAIMQARELLQQRCVNAVLGMGGFAAGPGGVAARLSKIPLLIHEQNAVAGTTNKLLRRVADVVMEAFPGALANAQHVGNPIRRDICEIPPLQADRHQRLNLLVLGGSLGALSLNQLIPKAIARLPEKARPLITHQCGKRHFEVTREAYQQHAVEANVAPFIGDMAAAYEQADIVIARSGALTVSELTACGRPSLLVPYPYAIDDHQAANARWLSDNDAATLYRENDVDAEKVAEWVWSMSQNRPRLQAQADNARKIAMVGAVDLVADQCEALAQQHKARGGHE